MHWKLASHWPWWLILLFALAGAILIARWYWRESKTVAKPWNVILPSLRGLAFALLLLMLLRPILRRSWIEGELSQIAMIVDTSQSMSTKDETMPSDPNQLLSRIEIVKKTLVDADGRSTLLDQIRKDHRVILQTLENEVIWDSQSDATYAPLDLLQADRPSTPIGESLQRLYRGYLGLVTEQQTDSPRGLDAVVLISDGQDNGSIPPVDLVSQLGNRYAPIYAVSVGQTKEPVDLGILSAEVSKQIRREDRLRGTLRCKEQAPSETPYRIVIRSDGVSIYQQSMVAKGRGVFEVDFDVAAADLLDRINARAGLIANRRALPINLECVIESDLEEHTAENNRLKTSTWGVLRENRVLMLDARGRWETRYIRNALDRDPAWDLQSYLGPNAFEKEFFPRSRADLFRFDLVIMTREAAIKLNEDQTKWLADFVGDSGGGLIWIEGGRLGSETTEHLQELLPFRKTTQGIFSDANELINSTSMRLTSLARGQPAFQLRSDASSNEQLWQELLGPHQFQSIEPKPGSEVMIELRKENAWQPMVITSSFGQGRVIAFSNDETWRWRYGVADLHHQRFWNQIANWVMRAPFVVTDTFASLDAGKRVYSAEESILIRGKLLNNDQQPLERGNVQAILSQKGKRLASVPLMEKPNSGGLYSAEYRNLTELIRHAEFDRNEEVTVQLEAVGIPAEALRLSTSFFVEKHLDIEASNLSCNKEMLQQVAEKTGGESLAIQDIERLPERLAVHKKGMVRETEWPLWQSYPWFMAIIVILAIEWLLRKRFGLV